MATLKHGIAALAVTMSLAAPGPAFAKGKLGFGTEVTVSGFFTPVLKRVKVASVKADSPAAAAGLQPGDYIIEANGRAIEGSPAKEMAAKLKNIQPGEHLKLKLKRGTQLVIADVVAGS